MISYTNASNMNDSPPILRAPSNTALFFSSPAEFTYETQCIIIPNITYRRDRIKTRRIEKRESLDKRKCFCNRVPRFFLSFVECPSRNSVSTSASNHDSFPQRYIEGIASARLRPWGLIMSMMRRFNLLCFPVLFPRRRVSFAKSAECGCSGREAKSMKRQ